MMPTTEPTATLGMNVLFTLHLRACVFKCVYPRPSSRLPVNWAKLVSRRKLRGDDGGDVSHLMVALSISTGD